MKTTSLLAAFVLTATALVTGCSSSGTSIVAGAGSALATGTIDREKGGASFDDEVAIDPAAHVVVSLRRYRGADAEAPLFVEYDRPFVGFPIDFAIAGDAKDAFEGRGELLVQATVYNHAGNALAVGDLTNEERVSIAARGAHVTMAVRGLERCGAPNGGGFCVGGE